MKMCISFLVAVILLSTPTSLHPQLQKKLYANPAHVPDPGILDATLREGVRVELADLDDSSRAWGLQSDQLLDAAHLAVESAGWTINNASRLSIEVSVQALSRHTGDRDTFSLGVHASGSAIQEGIDDSPGFPAEMSARKTLSVAKNGYSKILSTVNQMVGAVAYKLRRGALQYYVQQAKHKPGTPAQDDRNELK